MRPLKNFDQVLRTLKKKEPKKFSVARAADIEVLEAVNQAKESGICDAILVGNQPQIETIARKAGIDLSKFEIVHDEDYYNTIKIAIELVRKNHADILMKGLVDTADLISAVLDKDNGLRTDHLLSHVAVFEVRGYKRLILLTDAGLNIAPHFIEKVKIAQNAIELAHKLGIKEPKIAAITAIEKVNYPNMSATLEAAYLAKMSDRHQIKGAIIDGPLALDNAVSIESCRHKGIKSPVAGCADILLMPDIEAGNVLYKSLIYFARAKMAGLVMGAAVPITLVSRSDSHTTKFLSIALSAFVSHRS